MAIQIQLLSQSQTIFMPVLNVTTGAPLTGLAYDSAGLSCYYVRGGAFPVQIPLVTLADAGDVWTAGGFIEVDAVNMPGIYRLDLLDEMFTFPYAAVPVTLFGAADMALSQEVINVTRAFDPSSLTSVTIDGTWTLGDYMVFMGSVLVGKISGAEGTDIVVRDIQDTYDVLHTTVDANGNRTAVVINP